MTENMQYEFKPLNHVTYYPVFEDEEAVIPKGAEGVEIAYNASSKVYEKDGTIVHQNVYKWNGKIFNA